MTKEVREGGESGVLAPRVETDVREVERVALIIWQSREAQFPARVRRMRPDFFDRVSGAWDAVLRQAERQIADSKRAGK